MITLLPGSDPETELPYRVHMPPILFGMTDRPSRGWLRLEDQYVLLGRRAGMVGRFEVELALTILADLERLPIQRGDVDERAPQLEWLMLRGVYFDYMGTVTSYVDLLYDRSITPSHSADAIAEQLHDGTGWYVGQVSLVRAELIPVSVHADHFYSIDDKYYARVRKEI